MFNENPWRRRFGIIKKPTAASIPLVISTLNRLRRDILIPPSDSGDLRGWLLGWQHLILKKQIVQRLQ